MSITGYMSGVAKFQANLRKVASNFPDRALRALRTEMEIEVTEMKRRCPVDVTENAPHPGNLRNSIHVAEIVRDGRTLRCVVATGQQAPYAVYVHENPDAFHPVGEWKFMESVLNESRPYLLARLNARMRQGA